MRQADLQVGYEYAYPTYKAHNAAPLAARVRVVSVDGGGRVTVRVVSPSPKPPRHAWGVKPAGRDEQLQIPTRHLECPWEEWADRAATIGAELESKAADQQAWHDERDRRRADRLVADPGRALPDRYDEDHFYADEDAEELDALSKVYVQARGLGPYASPDELRPLLVDLPVPVLRDILATDWRQEPGVPGTVAACFTRAACLLETARLSVRSRRDRGSGDAAHLDELLGETDVAFVRAVREDVATAGGELLLPPVPTLPDWADEHDRALASTFGWLRLAVGDTDGSKLHSPGCSLVRSRSVFLTKHTPWWLVMLESRHRLYGKCGGPSARDLVALTGFVAAVEVWDARGRREIERWQQAAFQRLLVATAAARAQSLEPDITLASRAVTALAKNAPDARGWRAYVLVATTSSHYLHKELQELPPAEYEAARVLARDRLTELQAVLPPGLIPLPEDVEVDALRARYQQLKDRLAETIRPLDRLLFTLPNAY
ncbi:hypothetical protein [Crossiella sp. NPDC003009]